MASLDGGDPCGKSGTTYKKEALFSTCVGYQLAVVERRLGHNRYVVFDLNAGRPRNELIDMNVRGTTRTIYDKLRKRNVRAALWWCDKNRRVAKDLLAEADQLRSTDSLLGDGPRCLIRVVYENNATFAPKIPDEIRRIGQDPTGTYGVVIADPNGLHVPVRALGLVASAAQNLDVAVHLSASTHWWNYCDNGSNGPVRPVDSDGTLSSFTELFDTVSKRQWLMSETIGIGQGRGHHVLYGSNLSIPPLRLPGRLMNTITSREGREVLARVERRSFRERWV